MGYELKAEVHRRGCEFMQDEEVVNKLMLQPRGFRKTTAYTKSLLPWEIVKNLPESANVRILLGNEKAENAEDILSEIQGHFANNAMFRWLFPEVIPQNLRKTIWSKDAMLVPRTENWSEPTISTIGVTGTKVSQHFDLLHFDDIIGLAAFESPTVMKRAIRFLNYSRGLRNQSAERRARTNLVGTRWNLMDAYEHAVKNLNFVEFRVPPLVYDEEGKVVSAYPEVWPTEDLLEIMVSDPFQWATNFANNPYDITNADFDPEWLSGQHVWWGPDGYLRFVDSSGLLRVINPQKLRIYLHVDPSLGERDDSNDTAFVLVGLSDEGFVIVLDAWKKKISPTETLDRIFDYQDSHVPFKSTVEGVAYQKSLEYFAKERAQREGRYLNLESVLPGTRQDKVTRIKFKLQPYFRDRRVFYLKHLYQFVDEYNTFGRSHPDILDALAQGPGIWRFPVNENELQRRVKIHRRLVHRTGMTGYGS